MPFVKLNIEDGLGTIRNELLGKYVNIPPSGESLKESAKHGDPRGKACGPYPQLAGQSAHSWATFCLKPCENGITSKGWLLQM